MGCLVLERLKSTPILGFVDKYNNIINVQSIDFWSHLSWMHMDKHKARIEVVKDVFGCFNAFPCFFWWVDIFFFIIFFSFFLWMTSQVICHKDFVDLSLANKANIFSRAVSIFLFFLFSKSQEHQLLQWFWVSFEIKLPISQVSDLGEEMWNFEPIFFPFSSLILA